MPTTAVEYAPVNRRGMVMVREMTAVAKRWVNIGGLWRRDVCMANAVAAKGGE